MNYFSEVSSEEFNDLMAKAKVGADQDIRYWDGIYNVMAWLEGHGKHPSEYEAPEEKLPPGSRLATKEDYRNLARVLGYANEGATDGCH